MTKICFLLDRGISLLGQILFVFKTKICPKPGQPAKFKAEVIHIFMYKIAKLISFSVDAFMQRILSHKYILSTSRKQNLEPILNLRWL